MDKTIIIMIFILLVGSVTAVNYDYIYNPYSGRQDRSTSLNQSGNDIIADNITAKNGTNNLIAKANNSK